MKILLLITALMTGISASKAEIPVRREAVLAEYYLDGKPQYVLSYRVHNTSCEYVCIWLDRKNDRIDNGTIEDFFRSRTGGINLYEMAMEPANATYENKADALSDFVKFIEPGGVFAFYLSLEPEKAKKTELFLNDHLLALPEKEILKLLPGFDHENAEWIGYRYHFIYLPRDYSERFD